MTRQISYLDAVVEAQIEEMERDERVIMMGEDIAIYGSGDLLERFGANRVWNTPISEGGFSGVAIGAAIGGLRPIVDLSIASFAYLASDQIINQAAKLHFMTGGQIRVPVVFRISMYYAESLAAQHSDRPYPLFMNIPGLKILIPTTPADVKGLLKTAVRSDDPVILFEDIRLWNVKGEVPAEAETLVPIGVAAVRRPGTDVTIVAISGAMRAALEAVKALEVAGISAELIDPRTLKPFDIETVLKSVAKTGRLIIVENAHRMGAAGAEIAAQVAEDGFAYLEKPVIRLAAPDAHVGFSPVLERVLYPRKEDIVAAANRLLA